MRLLDFHDDMLDLIVTNLAVNECLVLMRVCKRTRDLVAGAALVARIAHALYFTPLDGVKNVICIPRHMWLVFLDNRRYALDDYWATCGDWHDPRMEKELAIAHVQMFGVEHCMPSVMVVGFRSKTRLQAGPASRGPQAVWQTDYVHMYFRVTAEGTVPAVTITFTKGFAHRRAAIVGRVLQEVDSDKAQLLTQAFAKCEDAHPSEGMHVPPNGDVVYIPEGSSKEHGVGVAIRMIDTPNRWPKAAEVMQVILTVL